MRPHVSSDTEYDDPKFEKLLEAAGEYAQRPTASIGSITFFILRELAKIVEFEVPRVGALSLSRSAASMRQSQLRSSLGESNFSEGEYFSDEEYWSDNDFLDELGIGSKTECRLVKHGNIAQSLYGEDCVVVYPPIDSVRFQLDTDILSADDKEKFGVKPKYHSKIVLSFQFGTGDYLADRRIPQVKVLHPKKKDDPDEEVRSGIGEQLENIARNFLERIWPSLHCPKEENIVSKLENLGYKKEYCELALEKCNWDYETAAMWLTDNLFALKKQAKKKKERKKPLLRGRRKGKEREEVSTVDAPLFSKEEKRKQLKLIERKKINVKKVLQESNRQQAVAAALHKRSMQVDSAVEDLLQAGIEIENVFEIISDQDDDGRPNMILELLTYLVRRMTNSSGFCLICDKPIIDQDIPHPTICTRGTCQFNYIELNVCRSIPVTICPSSIADDIMNNSDVVDLYISMAVAASTSSRKHMIFTPFPPMFETNNNKDYDKVAQCLAKFPSVDDMKSHCGSELQLIHYLAGIDSTGEIYKLLRWILSVNRSAMLKMPEKLHVTQMKTSHQYMMTAETNPEKASKFSEYRKEYGSYFAFHGSGIENWHSILRNGLLNCSGTNLQTTGAAYGPGVYLAPDSGTSMGYAKTGQAWKNSRFGNSNSLVCMAIAEVVKHPEVPKVPNPYFVIQNPHYVATRFFMFYPGGMGGMSSIMAADLDLAKYVQ
eukprot:CAMPEP_0174250868 /NCGR_PEP_ID=MMETSP0439-20130205/894_1 /TAXON_ID=0 /ORGANISM="Stereomyxa ramosa, Strain Chinc5" /LENGTH=714 /DNA_ID=CAMNT_0015331041 /DNA_START=212 /DNA_END=2356 /DNA_ORIENTATION=-